MSIVGANYGSRQPNNSAYIKNFVSGTPTNLWKTATYTPSGQPIISVITPTIVNESVLIEGDLYVNGSIINPSDVYLKENIRSIDIDCTNKIMNLKAEQFTFKSDPRHKVHYGFIAQDFEKEFPELVSVKPDNNVNLKAINYLEIIPLLLNKVQLQQKEIDDLKQRILALELVKENNILI